MFRNARIKLTIWYLLIIVTISVSFSFVIYSRYASEVERFDRMQRLRIETRIGYPPMIVVDQSLIEETEQRIIATLFLINVVILIVSGVTGYILAGLTLLPIKEMVDEQNRFISDASHEINTPLTSLKTAMEVYLREKKPTIDETRVLVSESIDEVNKLQALSTSLLQLAQYQKPKQEMIIEKMNIKEVVNEAIKEIQPIAAKKTIKIQEKVDNFNLYGDKYSLINLLVILIDNAVKYSKENSLIEIEGKKTDHTAFIGVKDHGEGINKKDLSRIFDRFYRADNARTKNAKGGYGLGLSIAKKIVETHSGQISVESKLGEGSTFKVYLPIKK